MGKVNTMNSKSSLPNVHDRDFLSGRGKGASHIMVFDNGQIVNCFGYQGKKQQLVDKCENHYLAHDAITAFRIHTSPFEACCMP
jgi:hypothetical protein